MRRALAPWSIALLALLSCARVRPPGAGEPARALEPEEARAAARQTKDPIRAADLAWLEGNDRSYAKEVLDRALSSEPYAPALLLRRASLAHLELDDASMRRDLLAILEHAPESPEAEAAAALLFDNVEEDSGVRAEIAAALDRSSILSAQLDAKIAPPTMAMATLTRARVAGAREDGPWIERGGWLTAVRSVGPLGARAQASLRGSTQHETVRIQAGARYHGLEPPIRAPARRWLEIFPVMADLDGLYVSETYVRLSDDGASRPVVLTAFLRSSGRVRIDGATVIERSSGPNEPAMQSVRVQLPAGWHRIAVVMLASSPAGFRLSLLREDGRQAVVESRSEPPPGDARFDSAPKLLPQEPRGFVHEVERQMGVADRELGLRFLGTSFSLTRLGRDLERARSLLRPIEPYAPHSAMRAAMESRLMSAEGRPSSQSQAALRRALSLDPKLPRALLGFARTLEADAVDQALDYVDRARAAAPASAEPHVLRFRLLRARGWNTEAEESLRAALERRPSRELLQEGARFYRQILRIPDAELLEARATEGRAPEASLRNASTALLHGEMDRALELLAAGAPHSARPIETWNRIAELELGRGRADAALRAIAKVHELDPFDAKALRLTAVASRVKGDDQAALSAIDHLRSLGIADFDLELFAAQITGQEPGLLSGPIAKQLEIDPRALATAAADQRWAGDKRVRLLERVVDTVRPDGYALTLTHSVVRLQTKEATDIAGEFRLPEGAVTLAARTLKADGRVIEVDRHEGKQDLSFSALAPGDSVEQKWLAFTPPESVFGGYMRRFFFQTDVPSRRTELVVVVPKGLSVWWHAYNGAPKPEILEGDKDVTYVFRSKDVAGLPVEPSVAPYEEFLPFVVVAAGIDPTLALDANATHLFNAARISWGVRTLAAALIAGAPSDEEKVARIFQWVSRNIRPGDFSEPHVTLATRRGDRTSLIGALLRSADIDARVVLARPGTAAQIDPAYPDPDRFGAILLRVDLPPTPTRRLWIRASGATASIGKAPPEMRGGAYLFLRDDGKPEVERFSNSEIDIWQISSRVELAVDAQGDARGTMVLSLPGQLGQGVRHGLRPLRPEDRDRAIQGWLNGVLPGARLESIALSSLDEEVGPFDLTARVLIPSLLHPEEGRLVSNRFFNEPVGMRALSGRPLEAYIRLSQRRMPLFVPEARERMEVTLQLPEGASAPIEAPQSFEKRAPFATVEQRFSWDERSRRASLVLIHDVPASRVPVDKFQSFLEYVQEVTLRTRNRLIIPLAGGPRAGGS